MMKNKGVVVKLLLGFSVLILLFALVSLLGIRNMKVSQKEIRLVAHHSLPQIIFITEIQETIHSLFEKTSLCLKNGNSELFKESQEFFKELERKAQSGEGTSNFAKLRKELQRYHVFLEEAWKWVTETGDAEKILQETGYSYRENAKNFLTKQYDTMEMYIEDGSDQDTSSNQLSAIGLASDMLYLGEQARIQMHQGQITQNTAFFEEARKTLKEITGKLDSLEANTEDIILRKQISIARKSLVNYEKAAELFITSWKGLHKSQEQLGEAEEIMLNLMEEASREEMKTAQKGGEASLEKLSTATTVLIGANIAAILMALLISYGIITSISRPLRKLISQVHRMETGDLDIYSEDFKGVTAGEFGKLAEAVLSLAASQRKAMGAIIQNTRTSTRQAQNLKDHAGETSNSMQSITVSLEQLKKLTQNNTEALEKSNGTSRTLESTSRNLAEHAEQEALFARKTHQDASEATQKIREVVQTMVQTEEDVHANEKQNQLLTKAVGDISAFISTIEGIASQTNLLALNASIEAARAGDAGRGFAVVAEEVRKLAEESREATRQIGDLITTLQGYAKESEKTAEKMKHTMERTIEDARKAENNLQKALEELEKISSESQQMAETSRTQANSNSHIVTLTEKALEGNKETIDNLGAISKSIVNTLNSADMVTRESSSIAEGARKLEEITEEFSFLEGNSGFSLTSKVQHI